MRVTGRMTDNTAKEKSGMRMGRSTRETLLMDQNKVKEKWPTTMEPIMREPLSSMRFME